MDEHSIPSRSFHSAWRLIKRHGLLTLLLAGAWLTSMASFSVLATEQPTGSKGASSVDQSIEGYWDAAISCPGGEIRFGVQFKRAQGQWSAFLVNGEEQIALEKTTPRSASRLIFGVTA